MPTDAARGWEGPPAGRAAHLLVLVVAATFPLVQLVKTVVDRAMTVRDVTGTTHFVSDGIAAQVGQLGLGLVAAAVAGHLVVRSLRVGTFRVTSWALLALVLLVAETLRREEPTTLVYAALTLLVVLAGGVMRVGAGTVGLVGVVAGLTAASNLVFATVNPERGWAQCRADKCTVAGGLLRGYYPQENVLGMFLATLVPAVAFIRRGWLRRAALVLVLVGVVLSGSRTSMAALVPGLWAYAVVRRRADPRRRHGDAAKVVGLVPVLAFAVSTVLLFTLTDMAFTGRGLIFRVVREAWEAQPVFGPGRGALEAAYYGSVTNWYLDHEHGEAAYLLAGAGLVGMGLGVLALLSIARATWQDGGPLPAVLALVPALGFLTEPTWEITLRSPYVASLLLTIVFVGQAARGQPVPPVPD